MVVSGQATLDVGEVKSSKKLSGLTCQDKRFANFTPFPPTQNRKRSARSSKKEEENRKKIKSGNSNLVVAKPTFAGVHPGLQAGLKNREFAKPIF